MSSENQNEMNVLFLTQEDLLEAGLFDFKLAQKEVEKGLVWHYSKKSLSDKVVIELDPRLDWKINSLVAINGDYSANKWLGSNTKNKENGKQRSVSTITLNDKISGYPVCIMDGTLVSAIRTGAYASIGMKYLGKEKNNVGILGTGVMAKSALVAILENYPERINNIYVYSRNPENVSNFIKIIKEKTGREVFALDNSVVLARGSDLLVSATTKNEDTTINYDDMRKGSTFIHIGGWTVDENFILGYAKNEKIVCDDWNLVKKRNAHPLPWAFNKGLILDRDVYGDIGEIIKGRKKGREENEKIYFDTVGIPEMDLVLAIKLYEIAKKKGLGEEKKLWREPHWLLN